MDVDRRTLEAAEREGVLAKGQAAALWAFLVERQDGRRDRVSDDEDRDGGQIPRFRAAHLLYYFGGLLAIGAASLFLNAAWEQLGPWIGAGLAIAYAVGCWHVAAWLLERRNLPIPAGLVGALVTVCTPLALYGLQQALGWWPEGHDAYADYHRWIDWHWWLMELGTLVVGAVVFYRFRLPFLTLPIAVTLWYMGMDVAAVATGGEADWALRRQFTMLFGFATVLFALWVDLRQSGPRDQAFWLYLFGLLGFWSALSATSSDSELAKLGYCAINLGLIVGGAVLARRTFVVFGGLGVAAYLGHLAHDVFRDSLLFPFALTLIGLATIAAGIVWQRHEPAIEARLGRVRPAWLRRALDARA